MNALVFGDGDSIWVKQVIEHTFSRENDTVTLWSRTDINKFKNFYDENSIKIVRYIPLKGNISYSLKAIYQNFRVIKSDYDIFCLHYIINAGLLFLPYAKIKSKKIILVFWGSDILKIQKPTLFRVFSFHLADKINLTTDEMVKKFHELYGHAFDKKIHRAYFGVNGLKSLDQCALSDNAIRNKYYIPHNKIVISVGYNTSPSQQHIEAISAINRLPQNEKDRIHILLRMTYGSGSEQYVELVERVCAEAGISFSVFKSYLSDSDVAEIIKITDIFVHAQVTDALSASMQEYMYAQCLVINPEWIKYPELEDAFFIIYSDFSELTDAIMNNLQRKKDSRFRDQLLNNKAIISRMSSWESCASTWRDLYNL